MKETTGNKKNEPSVQKKSAHLTQLATRSDIIKKKKKKKKKNTFLTKEDVVFFCFRFG